MRKPNRTRRIELGEEGLVLSPNQLYLGRNMADFDLIKPAP